MPRRVWKSINPLTPAIFVGIALAAVAIVPMLVERYVSRVREDASRITDPVRFAVREIQYFLVLETAGTRAYLLTGDSAYAVKHRDARARRRAEAEKLVALSREFGKYPGLLQLALELRQDLAPADALLDSLYAGALTRAEYLTRLPIQQGRLERATRTAREIGNTTSRIAANHLDEVHRAQVLGTVLTMILVALASIAALLVARLSRAYRWLAQREAQTRAESERISESRARLMRGFTHDVKNPLAAAAAHLNLIDTGIESPEAGLPRVRRALDNALRLVDELVNLARAEFGEITIQTSQVDLGDLVRQSADDVYGVVKSKGLRLDLEMSSELPLVVTDADRVKQIVDNLLSNAVKYTRSGGVTVEVATDTLDGMTTARVAVADTGPGLSPEERAQLFQEFKRLRTSAGEQGSGLGLAISQRVAHALGGEITVRSEPGKGSCFELSFPCQAGNPDAVTEIR